MVYIKSNMQIHASKKAKILRYKRCILHKIDSKNLTIFSTLKHENIYLSINVLDAMK